ncbi:MAG TPA: hypothetical protein VFS08_14660 [Gemmatimonadaceae bacterium]|nr:hypothetical protein [Gemmatimonadaceae bacterium]
MTDTRALSATRTARLAAAREPGARGHAPPARRARWHPLLLAVHVATTVSVLGADLTLLALGVAGAAGADPLTVYPAAHRIGAWLVAPLAVAALGTGLLLGATTRWGLVTYWWVAIKLAITTALTAVVLLVLVPALGRAADAATLPAAHALTGAARLRLAVAPAAASALLALNVALAVYKPRWRLRPPRATGPS